MLYTLRKAGPTDIPTYELSKWDEDRTRPLDVYTQWLPQRGDGSFKFHSCNCPSRANPCKHADISLALLEHIEELQLYYHDGNEVHRAADAPDDKELASLAMLFDP